MPMGQWINSQLNWFKSFFQETNGKASSRRIIEIAVVWVYLVTHLKVSLATDVIQDVPWGWGIIIAGILGLKTLDVFVKGKVSKETSNGQNNS